jgi:predicted ATPase
VQPRRRRARVRTRATSARNPGALPVFGTRVYGREAEVETIHALLAAGERLITLLGPGGVGKTRLAHEVAVRGAKARPAWFVDLSAAGDVTQVVRTIEAVLDPDRRSRPSTATALHMLVARIAGLGPTLLVLDNCEQAAAGVVQVCRALVAGCAGLQLLATSRTRLRLSFERSYRVAPLPADGDAALALLLDRVAMRGREPARGDAELATLREILQRLEGMPLAIELAAARLDVLAPAALLVRLAAQLDVLADDAVDRTPRQHSLRNAIAASWELLDEPRRDALASLSVFRGGWTLRGAAAVLEVPAAEVEAMLRDFVDRSLVRPTTSDAEPRFAMYEGLRQYAAEVLAAGATHRRIERRHADFILADTRSVADWTRMLDLPRKRAAEAERENLEAALAHLLRDPVDRAAVDGALVAAGVLASIDLAHGPWDVAIGWLDRALDGRRADLGTGALVADALCKRAYLLELLGRFDVAAADLDRGIAVASKAGAVAIELDLLRTRIHLDVREGRGADVVGLALRAVALADQQPGEPAERGFARWGLALALHATGALDEALAAIDVALEIEARELRGPRPSIYLALRGAILHELGRFAEAAADVDEAIAQVRGLDAPTYVGQFVLARGLIAVERGEAGADALLAEAIAVARTTGDDRTAFVATTARALARAIRGRHRAAETTLASIRAQRDRHGAEPAALFERATVFARAFARNRSGAARRAQVAAALISDDAATPLIRFARRVIAARVRGSAPGSRGLALQVSDDCSLIELPGGARVELGERAPARRLLRGLVARHLRAPGDPLTVGALAAQGWPGERIDARAAKNRVHVALAELRRSGLRELVHRSPRGYFLDPALRVEVVERAAGC